MGERAIIRRLPQAPQAGSVERVAGLAAELARLQSAADAEYAERLHAARRVFRCANFLCLIASHLFTIWSFCTRAVWEGVL